MSTWCVIVVPGAVRQPRNQLRDVVAANLLHGEGLLLTEVPDAEPARDDGPRRLQPGQGQESGAPFRQLDIVEAYWMDLIPNTGETHPLKRLFRGAALVSFWVLDRRTWKAAFTSSSAFIAFGYMLTGLLLTLWFVSLLVVAVDWLGFQANLEPLTTFATAVEPYSGAALRPIVERVPDWVSTALGAAAALTTAVGKLARDLAPAFVVVFPLSPLPVVVDLARFSQAYLVDEPVQNAVGLRSLLRARVRDAFLAARRYDRVILVAHSFGSLLAVDLLADWEPSSDLAKVKVLTLGSPAGIFAFKSRWVQQQVAAAVGRPGLGWADYRLKWDCWCTGLVSGAVRFPADALTLHTLHSGGSLVSSLGGGLHMSYFREDAFLHELLDAAHVRKPGMGADCAGADLLVARSG